MREHGKVGLLVDHYEHGAHCFSVAGTKQLRYQEFDSVASCVFVPRDDVQQEYSAKRAEIGEEKADAWMSECANSVLGEYTNYVNGQVFAVVVEKWVRDGGYWKSDEMADSIGGNVGRNHAVSSLRHMMDGLAPGAAAEEQRGSLQP